MEAVRRARWLGWSALGILAVALPLFFVPGGGESYGHQAWATAGVIVLHPAAFAGLGAFFAHRELSDDEQGRARVARIALPVVLGGVVLLWLFWT